MKTFWKLKSPHLIFRIATVQFPASAWSVSATTWQKRLNLATNRTRADTGDTGHVDTDYNFLIHKTFLIIYLIMFYLYSLNYIQILIDCVCDYVTYFLWSQVLECVLQGVPENSYVLPGLDNNKPRHCFLATSRPSTVQFLGVCKKVGKESQTGEVLGTVCLDRLVTYTVACSRAPECWIFGACAGYR